MGHGAPATTLHPVRNITLNFFEGVIAIPSKNPLTTPYNLQLQQSNGNYQYYIAIQPYVPFQTMLTHMRATDVNILGAVIYERHFDSMC